MSMQLTPRKPLVNFAGLQACQTRYMLVRVMVSMRFGRCLWSWERTRGVNTQRVLNIFVESRDWRPIRRVHLTLHLFYAPLAPITANSEKV